MIKRHYALQNVSPRYKKWKRMMNNGQQKKWTWRFMNYERKFASEWPFRDLRRGLFVANAIPSLLDVRQRADRERPQDVACSQPILAVQTVELVKVTPLSVPRPGLVLSVLTHFESEF